MDQFKVLTFNSRWKEPLVERLLWSVWAGNYDLCLIQELKSIMESRMTNQERRPDQYHFWRYPPVHASVKGELLLVWSSRLIYVTTVPIPASEIQIVILKTSESRFIGVINCHLSDQKASTKYFTHFLYPQLLYALSALFFGNVNAWGNIVSKVDLLVFGGDLNQAHPDFVPLSEVAAIRGRLRRCFIIKSGLLLFLTRLFGLRTTVNASYVNWTFGHRVFSDNYFLFDEPNVTAFNTRKFRDHFAQFLSWLGEKHPQFDLLTSEPCDEIYRKVMEFLHWEDGFSFFLLRQLYTVYLRGEDSFSSLTLGDIYFIKHPGWIDCLFVSGSASITMVYVGMHSVDPYPRISDHGVVETWFRFLVSNHFPHFDNPFAMWILQTLHANSHLPLDAQLDFITSLFENTNALIELGKELATLPFPG